MDINPNCGCYGILEEFLDTTVGKQYIQLTSFPHLSYVCNGMGHGDLVKYPFQSD